MLKISQLRKSYREKVALQGLNLEVAAGEIFCLLGPNGAGKTTTVNLLLNYIQPTSGTALIKGLDVTQYPLETKKHLAYIPEMVMLYRHLNGLENLEYFSALAGHRYQRAELTQFLERAGLPREAHSRRVEGYSKGCARKWVLPWPSPNRPGC